MGKMMYLKSDVIKERIVTIKMYDEEYNKQREYSQKHQQIIIETIKDRVNLLDLF